MTDACTLGCSRPLSKTTCDRSTLAGRSPPADTPACLPCAPTHQAQLAHNTAAHISNTLPPPFLLAQGFPASRVAFPHRRRRRAALEGDMGDVGARRLAEHLHGPIIRGTGAAGGIAGIPAGRAPDRQHGGQVRLRQGGALARQRLCGLTPPDDLGDVGATRAGGEQPQAL